MPAKDKYHHQVKQALINDGWTITHDPLTLSYGGREVYVDLGAERTLIAAEKATQKIAVEVKSFLSPSPVSDLEEAIGAYDVYRSLLSATEPERVLYLAVPQRTYEHIFTERFGQLLLSSIHLRLLVCDMTKEMITQWIPEE